MKKLLVAFAIAAVASMASAQIAGSPHDFSTNGMMSPTPVFSCKGCHTAHGAQMNDTLIWAVAPFTLTSVTAYSASTLTDASALRGIGSCLSCHATNSFTGLTTSMTTVAVGVDLRNDHPVGDSFTVGGTAQGFQATITLGGVTVTTGTVMTCATCHSVHNANAATAALLKQYAPATNICVACHNK